MFAGQTRSLPYVRNYREAHACFENTPKPPRSKKWDDNQRPLRDTRSYHYRIEKGEDYYDLILYSTVMARYHKPDAEGVELRQYHGELSQTSKGFMSNVLGVYCFCKRDTTDGRRVVMPVYHKDFKGTSFGLDAYFTADNKLIVERSRHVPHYKKISNADDKAQRANMKRLFEPLMMLAAMRLPEMTHARTVSYYSARPFTATRGDYYRDEHIRNLSEALIAGAQPAQEGAEAFMSLADAVAERLIGVRMANKGAFTYWGSNEGYDEQVHGPVSEADFMRSLWNKLQEVLRIDNRTGRIEYPQFPEPEQITYSNVVV